MLKRLCSMLLGFGESRCVLFSPIILYEFLYYICTTVLHADSFGSMTELKMLSRVPFAAFKCYGSGFPILPGFSEVFHLTNGLSSCREHCCYIFCDLVLIKTVV